MCRGKCDPPPSTPRACTSRNRERYLTPNSQQPNHRSISLHLHIADTSHGVPPLHSPHSNTGQAPRRLNSLHGTGIKSVPAHLDLAAGQPADEHLLRRPAGCSGYHRVWRLRSRRGSYDQRRGQVLLQWTGPRACCYYARVLDGEPEQALYAIFDVSVYTFIRVIA